MAEGDERIVLEGQKAIDLWLKGKDAWNKWVEKNPVADVNFSDVNFSRYRDHPTIVEGLWPFAYFIFPTGAVFFGNASFGDGDVSFDDVSFGNGGVSFYDTSFGNGNVSFWDASFGKGDVSFYQTSFGDGDVRFWGASFGEGDVRFAKTLFGDGNVNFTEVSFGKGDVSFWEASFGEGDVSFESIDFKGRADFSGLRNVNVVKSFSFTHSAFQSSLNISSEAPFGCIVDLTSTKLSNQVSLENLQCDLKKTESRWGSEWFGKAKACNIKDIGRLRRLKEIAGNNKNHDQALNFNVMEMQAKRWHQTTVAGLVFEFIFQKASDYGRSEIRPVVSMGVLWLLWSGLYYWLSDTIKNGEMDKILTAMTFSIGQMLSFVPISGVARSDGAELLFPGDQLPNAVIWLASFQSVISIILIFLIGLSLRNRFKV